jgi:PEP-CTERM motif
MKMIGRAALLFCVLTVSGLSYADTTVGTFNGGNCLPFMCNNSGTDVGQSIDYQQVFAPSAFSGLTTINTIAWYYDAAQGGNDVVLGGAYTFYWGYSNNPVNGLSSNLASNVMGSESLVGTATVPTGGSNYGPTLTLSGFAPFVYNPASGPLLLEVVVSNQDNVPNGSGNGFNESDDSGSVTSRAYCLPNLGCNTDSSGLVTTFGGTTTATPEPSSLLLLGSSLVGLAGLLGRKLIA